MHREERVQWTFRELETDCQEKKEGRVGLLELSTGVNVCMLEIKLCIWAKMAACTMLVCVLYFTVYVYMYVFTVFNIYICVWSIVQC